MCAKILMVILWSSLVHVLALLFTWGVIPKLDSCERLSFFSPFPSFGLGLVWTILHPSFHSCSPQPKSKDSSLFFVFFGGEHHIFNGYGGHLWAGSLADHVFDSEYELHYFFMRKRWKLALDHFYHNLLLHLILSFFTQSSFPSSSSSCPHHMWEQCFACLVKRLIDPSFLTYQRSQLSWPKVILTKTFY